MGKTDVTAMEFAATVFGLMTPTSVHRKGVIMEGAVTQHRVRALALIRDDRGDILAVRHARRGQRFWTLPGGFANIGESLDETLIREVSEETGFCVRVDCIAAVFEIGSSRWEPRRLEVCFRCTIAYHDFSLQRSNDGIVEVAWIDSHDIRGEFLPSKLLSFIRNGERGLYLGNLTDVDHPLAK